jgi:phosphoribosyl 1,2-cyclic phosphodiesterase
LHGYQGIGPSISQYHLDFPERVLALRKGTVFEIDNLFFEAIEARHSDPTSVGIKFKVPDIGSFGYTSDTGYFPELAEYLSDLRVLALGVIWPRNNPIQKHLCTDDALKIMKRVEPEVVLLTHFGMKMLKADPEKEAAYLERETGIPVKALKDGTKVFVDKDIKIKDP